MDAHIRREMHMQKEMHTDRKTGRCVHTEGGININIQGDSHECMHVDTGRYLCVNTHAHW